MSAHTSDALVVVRAGRSASAVFGLVVSLLAALPAAPAAAAQRFASAMSSDGTGTCTTAAPCRLDHAIAGASAGDEVIVQPGDYSVTSALSAPVSMYLHGVAGQPRPRLIGTSNLGGTTLSFKAGGTLSHLAIESTASDRDALALASSLAEDLVLTSSGRDGARLEGNGPRTTILRDSVARSMAKGSDREAIDLREAGSGGGDVALRNVTAIASGSDSTGVHCETKAVQSTLVNVMVRGDAKDVDASPGGARCSASYSNFRPALSPGLPAGTGNQSQDPAFVNAAVGDFHPAAGSPTVDAGTGDLLLGATDPDGNPRTMGAAPDIGAFEYQPSSSVSATAQNAGPPLAPPSSTLSSPLPSLGRTVVVSAASGTVLIKQRGQAKFTPLGHSAVIPVGSSVDTQRGVVTLVSAADSRGTIQAMNFSTGVFSVGQSSSGGGLTDIALTGGKFSSCPVRARSRAHARATAASAGRRRAIRRLWGNGHGRFRTHGRYGSATVRGTIWLTEDYCDGTLIRVRRGAVSVRDYTRRRTVTVLAGHSYFARAIR